MEREAEDVDCYPSTEVSFALDTNGASAHLLLTSKHRSTPSYRG